MKHGKTVMRCYRRVVRGVCVLAAIGLLPTTLLGQERLWTKYGNASGDLFGYSINFGADSDGDGFPEVVVGSPYAACNGSFSGRASLLQGHDGSDFQSVCGSPGQELGLAVAGGVDVNQDGIADLIIGTTADSRGGSSAGALMILSGADGSLLREVLGSSGALLGYSVMSVSDLDGDGARDYAVGVPSVSGGQQYVSVYSSISGNLLFTLTPTGGNLSFGRAIADAGDVNGDGVTDILVGDAVGDGVYHRTGRVWIFSGADGSILYSLEGEQADAYFGYSLDGIGDTDQDGYADFIVGAPYYQVSSIQQGKFYVYSGKNGTLLYNYLGYAGGRGILGAGVSGPGDVNHDGYVDFLAGDAGDQSGPREWGAVHLYSGRNGIRLYHWEGEYLTGAGIGGVPHGSADIDGDGRLDIPMGNGGDDTNGTDAGAVYVYSLEDFYCDAAPKIQKERSTISVQMSQTNPGNLVGLALVAIDGTPMFSFLAIAAADSLGRILVSDTVPRGWANHDIDLQGFAIGFTGKVVASNVEHLEFVQ